MDKHSEVEIKFEADKVSEKAYHEFVTGLSAEFPKPGKSVRIHGYKRVEGKDVYFTLHGQALRFRAGGDREAELTYKQRKSAASISDRVEINLPFKQGVSAYDVRALLGYLGAEEDFTITKVSYIYHVQGQVAGLKINEGNPDYRATLALYDVEDEDRNTRRFLEVEIESDSICLPEAGMKALDSWRRLIQNRLPVKGPLNQSLYEIYTTKGTDNAQK